MALTSQKSNIGFVEEIDHAELEFDKVVGRGAFGIVNKAHWRGITVAVKQIETENEKRAFVQELKQLSRVNHENIVKLYGASTKFPVCLVMEFADCGSLYNLLHGVNPVIEYKAAHTVSWTLQTALGVSYLHNMKPKAIIHRDLKPPNLLLVKRGTVIKLCDFGTAADIQTHMTNNKGSAAWMAPEVFEGNKYSEKCDVFSWGIVLWECLARKKPFDEIGGPAFRIMWAVHSGTRPPLLKGMPKPLEKLMIRCWSKNPAERPSMEEVVRVMWEIMPFYNDQCTPLNFPGQEVDAGSEASAGLSNESDSLAIDAILNTSSSPIDTPDRPRTNSSSASRSGSRPISHRDSEEVMMEPLELEAPLISVEEADRPSMKMSASMPTVKADAMGDIYSPRNIAKTTTVSNSKRYSADAEQLGQIMENFTIDETPAPQTTKPKRLGHRRVGSHGNPPIKLDPPTQPPPAHFHRMTTSASHPGEPIMDPLQHGNLSHSRSWAADNMMGAAASPVPYRPPRASEPQSTPTPPPSFSQLDDMLRPLQPLANNTQSMYIYYDHVNMAEKYITVQQEVANTRQRITELKRRLQEEKEKKQKHSQLMAKLQQLADENEEYMKMKQSFERQRREQGVMLP